MVIGGTKHQEQPVQCGQGTHQQDSRGRCYSWQEQNCLLHQGKTEVFTDQMEGQLQNNEKSDPDEEWEDEIATLRNFLIKKERVSFDEPIQATSPKETLETVRILKDPKAPEPDSILNTVLKNLSARGLTTVAKVMNAVFRV